jgi:hypothetical protein
MSHQLDRVAVQLHLTLRFEHEQQRADLLARHTWVQRPERANWDIGQETSGRGLQLARKAVRTHCRDDENMGL